MPTKPRDITNDKLFAIRKVRFDSNDIESVKFMIREVQILRTLDHPNVIKLEGLITSQSSSSLYLVFEYMEHDLLYLSHFLETSSQNHSNFSVDWIIATVEAFFVVT